MLRKLLRTAALGLAAAGIATSACGAPLQVVVPFDPGGGSDLFARLVAPGISKALNESVIVENRSGAGGIIGADLVAKSRPANNMVLVSDSSIYTIAPSLYKSLPFKRKDLVPVANLGMFGNLLVVAGNSPYKTLGDMLAAARAHPGKLTIASSGNGSITHLTAEKLMEAAHIKLIHVPYKGTGPAITDTMGGHVDMVFTGLPAVAGLLSSGQLRALAIATPERSAFAPDIPTFNEAGVPGFTSLISQGLFAPATTPVDRIKAINAAVVNYLNSPSMKDTLRKQMVEPVSQSPEEYKQWLDKQAQTWGVLIKKENITVN